MHLLVTSVGDVTSDLLCEWAGQTVLRINLEQHKDLRLRIDAEGFEVADAFGRRVTQENIQNVIWRKPLDDVDSSLGEHWYAFHEFRYAVRALVASRVRESPRSVPINPFQLALIDKRYQLIAAAHYFRVPDWSFTTEPSQVSFRDAITKTWCGKPVLGTGEVPKFLFAAPVDIGSLADGWPWFIQERVDSSQDVTVVHVDGRNFAFALDRSRFDGLDWRPHIGSDATNDAWHPIPLSDSVSGRINALMRDLHLRYGRLDFLANDADAENPWFLEVNPNGQWAWLDPTLENGLFRAMTAFLFSSDS